MAPQIEDGDSNSMAMTLAKEINASNQEKLTTNTKCPLHHHPRPSTPQPTSSESEDDGPPSKKTARALRAKRNLTTVTKRIPLRRHRRPPTPQYTSSSEGDSNRPREVPTSAITNQPDEGPSNEVIGDNNDGPMTSINTIQLLDAGISGASKKRPHSSSPVSQTKLGSKENPIDVDGFASLLEPMVTREYV